MAEANGFPIPRCVTIETIADLDALTELRFPAVVKPSIKSALYIDGQFARGYKVGSPKEADSICRRILSSVPGLVVQEWIEGADSDIYFCLLYRSVDGTTICSFTGRKLAIWPPDVGITASCVAAPEAHCILQPLTEAFFERASFVGIGGIEYKKDGRTGQFLMIEPTLGRLDANEEVATLNGVNIPLAAYCYELGLPFAAEDATHSPVNWRDSLSYWRSVRRNGAQPAVEPGTRIRDAYWRWADPKPALARVLREIANQRRRLGRYAGRS